MPAAFMLLLIACGGGQPIPDIDASGEAKSQAKRKTMVEATPTIVPPTATLTPTSSDSSFTITSMLCSDGQGPDCMNTPSKAAEKPSTHAVTMHWEERFQE